jgi:peptidyl-prolyl cis-trans isomerase SurA
MSGTAFRLATLILSLGAGLAALSTGGAEPVYLDGIAAQVGQEIVLTSEIEEQLAIASLRLGLADSNVAQAREEVFQRIIDEKIIVQEARARGISVSSEEVEQAVTQHLDLIRKQLGGEETFQRELAKEGLTAEELRDRYREEARRDLLYTRLIQREIYSKIDVTDEEVDQYYQEHKAELPRKAGKVELAQIFIGLRPEENTIAAAQEKLDRIRARLSGGDSFADVARAHSDDRATREQGGDLGWFNPGDLDEHMAEVTAALKPGETSEPFQVPLGIEIIRLAERDSTRVHLQHIRVALEVSPEARRRLRERAERLREQAAAGTDFAVLADQHSDDRESAAKGGNLGDFNEVELSPAVADAVRELKPGELTGVVETDVGFHVFKVVKREGGGEYELADIRDRLRDRIIEERAAQRTQAWLTGVRANYFIRRADKERAPGGELKGQQTEQQPDLKSSLPESPEVGQ